MAWREVRSLKPISTIALADRHHVAALQRGEAMVLGRIAPPDVDLAGEVGMKLVDGCRQDRLFVPRGPIKRVERDAAVDPARGVARIQRIGKGRQQVFGHARGLADEFEHVAAVGVGEVKGRQAANQGFGELRGCQAVEIAADLVDQAKADLVGHDLIVENPLLGFGDRDRFGEQVMHLDDIDAAIAHLLHEVEMVALGVVDPQDVVKQQGVAVGRRQRVDAHVPAHTP